MPLREKVSEKVQFDLDILNIVIRRSNCKARFDDWNGLCSLEETAAYCVSPALLQERRRDFIDPRKKARGCVYFRLIFSCICNLYV